MVIIIFTYFALQEVVVMSQKSEFDAKIASAGIRRISPSRKISLKGAQRIALPSFLTEAHSPDSKQDRGWNLFTASVRPV